MAAKSKSSPSDYLFSLVWIGAILYGVAFFLQNSYNIRLQAINEYGPVIHEFDPYFNWRATQYLYENGAAKFFKWFDHMVWYPLVSLFERGTYLLCCDWPDLLLI
jgi:dolichyl-diphosphooligosaccharide--protein glycosyltransferase